ncbi:hypothetical protein [uncultured Polaribacter sp.]|uniref:hypothetical protein n=1 Tax=uncultured Polaribacter sp. TaxID=174711 RepID=UPI002604BB6A|nr:hypothetical protein [uncultured Polaribacter sp.]
MKKGIIIIFGKNEGILSNTLNFSTFFNEKIKICLVNNGNHDNFFKEIQSLKEPLNNDVAIVNLRKETSIKLAVKAGVRFLSNKEDIQLIIYAQPISIANPMLLKKLIAVFKQEFISKKEERVLLRSVYSLNEVLNDKK